MNKSKKILSAIASTAAVLSMVVFVYPKSMASQETITISPKHMYILADTNKAVSLSSISATMDGKNSVTGDQLTWKSDDKNLTVDKSELKASTDGVHKVNISFAAAGVSADIYVVAKQASAKEYILYQENFDSVENGKLPDGWIVCDKAAGSSVAVQDGKLVIDSSVKNGLASVRMPGFLNVFDNYTAEADFSIAATYNNDMTRYCSLIYRMQVDESKKSYFPYYQMTVRQKKAGDSVELSGRTPSDSWDTKKENTKDHGMTLDPKTVYKDKVVLNGNYVKEYFNDKLYIEYSGLDPAYSNGGTGLLSGGSKSVWDNIKISIQPDNLEKLPENTTTTTVTTTTNTTTTTTTATSTTKPTDSTTTKISDTTTKDTATTTTAKADTTTASATESKTTVDNTTAAPTEAIADTTTATSATNESPKTGSAAVSTGLVLLTAASSVVVFLNRKKK